MFLLKFDQILLNFIYTKIRGYLNILNEKILMDISLSSKSKLDYINRLEKILEK